MTGDVDRLGLVAAFTRVEAWKPWKVYQRANYACLYVLYVYKYIYVLQRTGTFLISSLGHPHFRDVKCNNSTQGVFIKGYKNNTCGVLESDGFESKPQVHVTIVPAKFVMIIVSHPKRPHLGGRILSFRSFDRQSIFKEERGKEDDDEEDNNNEDKEMLL